MITRLSYLTLLSKQIIKLHQLLATQILQRDEIVSIHQNTKLINILNTNRLQNFKFKLSSKYN